VLQAGDRITCPRLQTAPRIRTGRTEARALMSAVAEFFESFGRAFSHLVVWAFLLGVGANL